MRRTIAISICLTLLTALLSGCAAGTSDTLPTVTEEPSIEAAPTPDPAEETPAGTEDAPVEPEDAPEATAGPADAGEDREEPPAPEEQRGHYRFQPKVCSSFMVELFGEPMRDAWYGLVDAVMAGEDTFACPDDHTYDWVMGQFPDKCFPVLEQLIDYCYDRDHPVKDGVASFTYRVPREEAAAQIEAFAALVEDILNSTLRDDWSDTEKALALYIYFSHHYTYDYEAARPDVVPDYLSSYRVLTTGTGICQEFSVAYAYLLLQAGVDATNMSGHRTYDRASHQWTYVRIDGHNFHIDPTYVIGNTDALGYFMMDDAQREAEDCYDRAEFVICSNYAQDHPQPDYRADDDSFREIWQGRYVGFDHESRTLTYAVYNEQGELIAKDFDYTGW